MRAFRVIATLALVLVVLSTAGAAACRNCGLVFDGEGDYCPDCARRFEAERERAMKELVYVERVAKARLEYERAIDELAKYYLAEGDAQKADDARREQADLKAVRKYDYLCLAELLGADLKPTRAIAEAETLYRDGLNYYEHFAWPWQKKDRYALAIQRFKELVKTYPESDRIDDAAYYLGRCYEKKYFKDYRRAITWYQRCFEWNPQTAFDPRYRIARIYDVKLEQRDKALRFYHLVVRDGSQSKRVEEAQRRIDALRKQALREREEAVTKPDRPAGP